MDPVADFEALFDLAADLLCVAGTDGYFRRVNPAFTRTLGYSSEELLARPFIELIHPDDLQPTIAAIQTLGEGCPVVDFENRYRKHDGTWCTLQWRSTPRGPLIYATARDITATREAEAAHRERAVRLEAILENIPLFVALHDGAGRVTFVNGEFERRIGWSTEDLAHADILDLCYPDPEVRQEVEAALKTVDTTWHRFPVRTRFGSVREVTWRGAQLDDRQRIVIGQDVTDARRNERLTADTARRFEQLAAEVPVGVFETDPQGRCIYANRRWQEIAGIGLREALGDGWVSGIHSDDRPAVFDEWIRSVAEKREFRLEYRFRNRHGVETWVEGRAVATLDADGRVVGYLGTVLDITARVHAQARLVDALEAAQAGTRSKSDFLAAMSHEIRTPMNGIIGMAELLLDTQLDAGQKDDVATIRRSADSLLTILNDILDFSKIEAGRLDFESIPFDLKRTVTDVVQLMAQKAEAKGLKLNLDLNPGQPHWLIGDPNRIRQILLNLTGNAVKFTASGSVSIAVTGQQPVDGRARFRVSVADTGIGISAAAQASLFTKFTQADSSTSRKFGGTGLGLAISRQLVEMMHGTIGLDSQPGQGSTFWFELELPVAEAPGPDAEPDQITPAKTEGAQVLLADDNPVNRKVAGRMFERLGCRVTEANDGVEAVAKAAAGSFAIIFMDCQMPEMDGFEATGRIRASGNRTPIVAMTANALVGDRERCLEAGMDDYLTKPAKLDQLRQMVERWAPSATPGN